MRQKEECPCSACTEWRRRTFTPTVFWAMQKEINIALVQNRNWSKEVDEQLKKDAREKQSEFYARQTERILRRAMAARGRKGGK